MIPEKRSKMSDISWRADIETIAGPYSGNRKSWLATAARRTRLSYRTIKSLYYGELTDPRYSVGERVRSAAEEARREAIARATQFEQLAGVLSAKNSEIYGEEIARLVLLARALRGVDRTGTNKLNPSNPDP